MLQLLFCVLKQPLGSPDNMPLSISEQLNILIRTTQGNQVRLVRIEKTLSKQKAVLAIYATALGGVISVIVGIFFKLIK